MSTMVKYSDDTFFKFQQNTCIFYFMQWQEKLDEHSALFLLIFIEGAIRSNQI